jgi:hypothetical protein
MRTYLKLLSLLAVITIPAYLSIQASLTDVVPLAETEQQQPYLKL